MWILFSVLCMASLTAADIIGKKAVASDALAPLILRIFFMAASFVVGLVMYALGVGESGLAPWQLLAEHPIILFAVLCLILSEFLYTYSLRYIGMSVMEAISGFEGVAIFLGLVVINYASGELGAVRDMLVPARLILICIILIFTALLPNVETIANRRTAKREELCRARTRLVIGAAIALLAVAGGAGDSLINDILLDGAYIGGADYVMTAYFSAIIPLPVFCIVLLMNRKRMKAAVRHTNRFAVIYVLLYLAQIFFGLTATSMDAVRSEILYLAYPVISILGAKIFLKEHYTWRQNLCIWIITAAAIGFCCIDSFV